MAGLTENISSVLGVITPGVVAVLGFLFKSLMAKFKDLETSHQQMAQDRERLKTLEADLLAAKQVIVTHDNSLNLLKVDIARFETKLDIFLDRSL